MNYSAVRKWIVASIVIVGLLLAVGAIVGFYALAPEFHRIARTRTEDYLQARFKSSVEFADFHVSVYPRIHLVIDGLIMRHEGRTDIPPLIQISTITIDANFASLFAARPVISHVTLAGLRINTPPHQPGGKPVIHGTQVDLSSKFPVTIATITADDARLVILRRDTKPPHEFEIHRLEMDNFDFNNPASFHALLTNPVPRGEI
ncbi:MAG: hypothetical protein ABSF78_11635, partial [Candidatus Acidiferrales bacterium]